MPPAQIGRYHVERELGRGGMAVVYLARDPFMKRQVAIKLLPRQFTHDPHFLVRFQREAEVVAALEHPAIVPVYDFGEFEEQPYIVMRFMPGGSLVLPLQEGPLSIAQATLVLQRIGAALDFAHGRGVIHRDLKPGNILLDQEGQPYLSDFGLVKLSEPGPALTKDSRIMGTPAYMSPEQARGEPDIDGRSDIYALGVILFEMLTGQVPYTADTPMGVAMRHVMDPVPDLLAVRPDLPPLCQRVIDQAMAKERDQRTNRAGALAVTLASLNQGTSHLPADQTATMPAPAAKTAARPAHPTPNAQTNTTAILQPAPASAQWARWPLLLMALLLAGVLLFAGLLAVFRDTPAPPPAANMTATPSAPVAQATSTAALAAPASSTSTATPAATATPTLWPAVVFADDEFGILLAGHETAGEIALLLALLRSELQSTLAQSGLVANTSVGLAAQPGGEAATLLQSSHARLVAFIILSPESGGYTLTFDSAFASSRDDASLQAISNALAESIQVASLSEGGSLLANRLAAIVNAAIGYDALHDGAYSECSRRFTAVLDLTAQIEVTFSRAEASHVALATCLDALGRNEDARSQYEAAIASNPEYALAYYGLGNYWYLQKEYERAGDYYQETLARSQVDPLASAVTVGRAYAGLGNIALIQEDFAAAVAAFDEAIAQEPEQPAYYLARAGAYRGLDLEEEARQDLNRCVELAGDPQMDQSDYYRELQESCLSLLVEAEEADVPVVATIPTIPAATAVSATATPPVQATETPDQVAATVPPTVPPPTNEPPTVPPPTEPPTVPPTIPPPATQTAEPP